MINDGEEFILNRAATIDFFPYGRRRKKRVKVHFTRYERVKKAGIMKL